jgi:hypothetical protein
MASTTEFSSTPIMPLRKPTTLQRMVGGNRDVGLSSELGDGWLTICRSHRHPVEQDSLAEHAHWNGPIKLVERRHGAHTTIEQRFEVCWQQSGSCVGWGGEAALDEELAGEQSSLLTTLSDGAVAWNPIAPRTDWQPPKLDQLDAWLRSAGYEPASDDQSNLRLTVHRAGFAGQVRVVCGPGQLRFTMPLGRWKDLASSSNRAMRGLAGLANERTRLLRIAWHPAADDASTRCCEAQVDLTGLPWRSEPGRGMQIFWQGLIANSVAALHAAAHQLGIELDLLASSYGGQLANSLPELIASG